MLTTFKLLPTFFIPGTVESETPAPTIQELTAAFTSSNDRNILEKNLTHIFRNKSPLLIKELCSSPLESKPAICWINSKKLLQQMYPNIFFTLKKEIESIDTAVRSTRPMVARNYSKETLENECKEYSQVSSSAIDELKNTCAHSRKKEDQDRIATKIHTLLETKSDQLIGELMTADRRSQKKWQETASFIKQMWPDTHKRLKLNMTTIAELADLLKNGDEKALANYLHKDSQGAIGKRFRSLQLPQDFEKVEAICHPALRRRILHYLIKPFPGHTVKEVHAALSELASIQSRVSATLQHDLFCRIEKLLPQLMELPTELWKSAFVSLLDNIIKRSSNRADLCLDNCPLLLRKFIELDFFKSLNIKNLSIDHCEASLEELQEVIGCQPELDCLSLYCNTETFAQRLVDLHPLFHLSFIDLCFSPMKKESPEKQHKLFGDMEEALKVLVEKPDNEWRLHFKPWLHALKEVYDSKELIEICMDSYPFLLRELINLDISTMKKSFQKEPDFLCNIEQLLTHLSSKPNEKSDAYFELCCDALKEAYPDKVKFLHRMENYPSLLNKLIKLDFFKNKLWCNALNEAYPDKLKLLLRIENHPYLLNKLLDLDFFKNLEILPENVETFIAHQPQLGPMNVSCKAGNFPQCIVHLSLILNHPHIHFNIPPIEKQSLEEQNKLFRKMEEVLPALLVMPNNDWSPFFERWFQTIVEAYEDQEELELCMEGCPLLFKTIVEMQILKMFDVKTLNIIDCQPSLVDVELLKQTMPPLRLLRRSAIPDESPDREEYERCLSDLSTSCFVHNRNSQYVTYYSH